MKNTKINTIELDYDVIEIHYNELLSKKPYLVRIFNYDLEPQEIRLEKEEIKNLYNILKQQKLI